MGVMMWDLRAGIGIARVRAHEDKVNSIAMDWASGRVLTSSRDETLSFFDLESKSRLWMLDGHSESVKLVSASFAHSRAVSVAVGGTLKFWNLESLGCIRTLELHAEIASYKVEWKSMEALVLLTNGTVTLLELHDGSSFASAQAYQCDVRESTLF